MANYVPPEFQGIDYSQYHNWPAVKVGPNVYYQVPGVSDFVYDPSRGQHGSYIRTDSLDTAYRDTHPKIPSLGSQIAQGGALIGAATLGRIGASALGNSIFGGGTAASPGGASVIPASATQGGGGLIGSILGDGSGTGYIDSIAAGDTGVPTSFGVGGGGEGLTEAAASNPLNYADYAASSGDVAPSVAAADAGGGGLLGLASLALPALGAAYTGYRLKTMYDDAKDNPKSFSSGAKEGLKPANLIANTAFLGAPSLAGGLMSEFFGGPTTNVEGKMTRDLNSQGIKTIEDGTKPDETRNREQQADDYKKQYGLNDTFQGYTPDKKWVNNQWLTTGDVNNLRTQDTTGYSVWSKALGNDYYNTTSDDRSKINSYALQNGLVKEGKGSLSLDGDQSALDKFHDYANSVISGKDDPSQDYRSRWDYDVIKQSQADGSSGMPTSVSADSPSTSDSSNPTPKVDEATANTGVSLPGTPFANIGGIGKSPIQTNVLTGKPLIVADPTDPVTPMMTKFSAVADPNSQSIQLQPLTVGKLGVSTIPNSNFSYRYV